MQRQLTPNVHKLLEASTGRFAEGEPWALGIALRHHIGARELTLAEVAYLQPLAVRPEAFATLLVEVVPRLRRATTSDLQWVHQHRHAGALLRFPRRFDRRSASPQALIAEIDVEGEGAVWTLGLASLDRSGFVREAAVDALCRRPERCSTAFLLLRANDWVEPVARRAADELRRRATSRPLDLAHHLPLVDALLVAGRRPLRPLAAEILRVLREEPGQASLLAALSGSADLRVRRAAFRELAAVGRAGDPDVVELVLGDRDAGLRLALARWARAALPAEAALWRRLERDRQPAVRRLAVLAAAALPDAVPHLKPWLVDPNRSVRELVRFVLARAGSSDALEVYRLGCATERPPPGAIAGLGEVGAPEDAEVLERFLVDGQVAVRREAVRGLGRLLPEADLRRLLPFVDDPAPSVSRAAAAALERAAVDEEVLLAAGHRSYLAPHAARARLRLIARAGGWRAAVLLLEASTLPAFASVGADIERRLTRWVARSRQRFVAPSRAEAERLRDALGRSEETLGVSWPGVRRELADWAPRVE